MFQLDVAVVAAARRAAGQVVERLLRHAGLRRLRRYGGAGPGGVSSGAVGTEQGLLRYESSG